MSQHFGPTGASNDVPNIDLPLEPGSPFKPKELETFESDRAQVLGISPEQGPNFLNGQKQVPVGNMNKDNH